MQAIILIELYAVFKARRPRSRLSHDFELVYNYVSVVRLTVHSVANFFDQVLNDQFLDDMLSIEELSDTASGDMDPATAASLILRCRQRLVYTCMVLDVQHSVLFGHPRTKKHVVIEHDLYDFDEAKGYLSATATFAAMNENGAVELDAHMLSIGIMDPIEGQHRELSELANTYQLCSLIPARSLIAVAGETWIISEKLSSREEYAACQRKARAWAEGRQDEANVDTHPTKTPPVREAVKRALLMLDSYRTQPHSGSLFQEWSIYLAAIVIWSRAYAMDDTRGRRPRLSVPLPTEPQVSSQELDSAMAEICNLDEEREITLRQAKIVLLWTKTQIAKADPLHLSGLENCARDVLGMLILRGEEGGWFGS